MLRKLECLLMPAQLEPLRDTLLKDGVEGMTVSEARGVGTRSKIVKGKPQFEARVKVEIVIEESMVDDTIRRIKDLVGAGQMGAGMIFVLPVEDAVRLATREAGKTAIA